MASNAWTYDRFRDFDKNSQEKMEYDASNNLVYRGIAVHGLAADATAWTIFYHTYDASDNLLTVTSTNDSWDNRATATYA